MIDYRDITVTGQSGQFILRDFSLSIAPGESVAFLGRSGAGKTTALRLVNGLIQPSGGMILVDSQDLRQADLVAMRRRTGYIIQGIGLFPHRTIADNIATVPRLLGWTEERIRGEAEALMTRLGLPWDRYADRFPRSLSGGEQQRVGIARAIISSPSILLCDEPFASLDPIARRDLQRAFVAVHRERRSTMIFVTHDVYEALQVADRVVLIDSGSVVLDCRSAKFLQSKLPLARRFAESLMMGGPA